MKKVILVSLLLIGGLLALLLLRDPVIQNKISRVNPDSRKAVNPPSNINQKKQGNEQGRLLTKQFNETYAKQSINSMLRSYYAPSGKIVEAEYDVDHYTVTYNTTDEKNVLLTNTAQIYIPKVDTPQDFPIYVFGSGTTGIDDKCAPSKEIVEIDNWGNYRSHMLAYASQGFIVFFPDYEGFNDGPERIHHYFHAKLEANIMLDGARATYDFFTKEQLQAKPKNAVFFSGYSQGGHAAFAAKDYASEYAPELPIKGVIGYAPTTNLIGLLQENAYLAPYLIVAFKDMYGEKIVNPSALFQSKWLPNLESVTKDKCVSEVKRYFPSDKKNLYTSEFLQSLNTDLESGFFEFKNVLTKNSTGLIKSDIPSFVIQGGSDPIVTNETQKKFITAACNVGNRVAYKIYPGIHHYETRQVSFHDALSWMRDRLENKTPPNDCS